MKTAINILVILVILLALVWLGLQVKPSAFKMPSLANTETRVVPIPEGLPAPVERFYRTVYGDQIPLIDSVVITGHGRIRPFGVWLPARFVMVHNTGRDYRHYFEATFFGFPFLKINEGYMDGESFFESPMGNFYNDPKTNQGANLALWAEGGWFPAIWATDPRARWQAVDEHTAILFVPFGEQEESLVVRFNPQSGLVEMMEAMRYKTTSVQNKTLWITNEVQRQGQPAISYATWFDDGKSWAEFIVDEMLCNLDVSEYIRARGQ